ncbi:MAG: helix-turn-helix domain-containing protein [Microbacter sp.]
MKDRISQIIKEKGLTSGKFAEFIGTQPSVISHILNGRNKPSTEIIQKILSSFTDINPEWLILGAGNMHRELQQAQPTLFNENRQNDASTSTDISKSKASNRMSIKESEVVQVVGDESKQSEKRIKKITVYFSDMTFEEFVPSNPED